jgi:hypothetical protein
MDTDIPRLDSAMVAMGTMAMDTVDMVAMATITTAMAI